MQCEEGLVKAVWESSPLFKSGEALKTSALSCCCQCCPTLSHEAVRGQEDWTWYVKEAFVNTVWVDTPFLQGGEAP